MGEESEKPDEGKIDLKPPWPVSADAPGPFCHFEPHPQASPGKQAETAKVFIEERSAVHTEYIREDQRTRRLTLMLAAGLIAVAALVSVFAPAGHEVLAYAAAVALVAFAAGAIGFTAIKWKGAEFTKDSDRS